MAGHAGYRMAMGNQTLPEPLGHGQGKLWLADDTKALFNTLTTLRN